MRADVARPPSLRYVDALLDAADRADKIDGIRLEIERHKAIAEATNQDNSAGGVADVKPT